MKKKIVVFIFGVAITSAVVLNVCVGLRGPSLSDLTLANIEALAKGEKPKDCYRIKSFIQCSNYSFAITECELYDNSVFGSTCAVTHCP